MTLTPEMIRQRKLEDLAVKADNLALVARFVAEKLMEPPPKDDALIEIDDDEANILAFIASATRTAVYDLRCFIEEEVTA